MVRLLVEEFEACSFIDAPCGFEDRVRPQNHLLVARPPGEFDTCVDERRSDSESAR
jgi:hypothetical protein